MFDTFYVREANTIRGKNYKQKQRQYIAFDLVIWLCVDIPSTIHCNASLFDHCHIQSRFFHFALK